MRILLIFMVFLMMVTGLYAGDNPGERHYGENWGYGITHRTIRNLTLLLLKDVEVKLRAANIAQEQFKHSIAYELGNLAAGIMDKYKEIIKLYRRASNLRDFKQQVWTVREYIAVYHVMQTYYFDLRLEKDLYYEAYERLTKPGTEDPSVSKFMKDSNMSDLTPEQIKKLKDMGYIKRRSMNLMSNDQNVPTFTDLGEDKIDRKDFIEMEKVKRGVKNYIGRKGLKNQKWQKHDSEEEELKKKLQFIMWAEGANGFNPENKGVSIPKNVVNAGLVNASHSLAKELKDLL